MGFSLEEIENLTNSTFKDRFEGVKVVSAVCELVRVEITKSKVKSLVAIFQSSEDYPSSTLLIELKSKTLGDVLMAKLTTALENYIKNYIGEPQVLKAVEYLHKFIVENPLCCCADEVTKARKGKLLPTDEIKLKQKSSKVILSLHEGTYFHKVSLEVPDSYPDQQVIIECLESSFPDNIQRFLKGYATEIARKHVEPPLNKKNTNRSNFVPTPSVLSILSFLADQVHGLPTQVCSVCKKNGLPENSVDIVNDEFHDLHVERIYCGHTYHYKCLIEYMKTPPFTGGKKCLACQQRIYHDKYRISPELSEARWAHQQARDRELDEVVDFFK